MEPGQVLEQLALDPGMLSLRWSWDVSFGRILSWKWLCLRVSGDAPGAKVISTLLDVGGNKIERKEKIWPLPSKIYNIVGKLFKLTNIS